MLKELGDNVERQKMSAIGATNLLKSIAKDRESEQTKLQVSLMIAFLNTLLSQTVYFCSLALKISLKKKCSLFSQSTFENHKLQTKNNIQLYTYICFKQKLLLFLTSIKST